MPRLKAPCPRPGVGSVLVRSYQRRGDARVLLQGVSCVQLPVVVFLAMGYLHAS